MLQATRPQTLGDAVTDSPVGQLAWIAEKFREWTDSTDRPEDAIDRDQLLTTISVYWFTCTANSSARLYYEYGHSGAAWGKVEPSSAPTGVAVFPREIARPSAASLNDRTTSCTGRRSTVAATSRRWNSRSCWPVTCALFRRFRRAEA